MLSYWEKKHFINYDNIIIGAGIAGLFTALNLKERFPDESVLVVDKEYFPSATTKNAGFACMGSITELEDDLKTTSLDNVINLFEKRYRGLQIMRTMLGDANIGYEENGSYELLSMADELMLEKVSVWNERLFHIANKPFFASADISNFSFNQFGGAIQNLHEGAIDSGKMWKWLKHKASELGIDFMMGMGILSFEKVNEQYCLSSAQRFSLNTGRLIICTNAFTNNLLPQLDITPARGQVLVTKPVQGLKLNGIYHFDRGYYYFREIDGRVLFGGGRQLDKVGETTTEQGSNQLILDDLKNKLAELILPNTPFEIDYNWSGIMGFAANKEPVIKQVDKQLYVLAGFGGMGVALAPFMAQELTRLIG